MFYLVRDKEERGGKLLIFKKRPKTNSLGVWFNDTSKETGIDGSVSRTPNWELPKEWFPSIKYESGPVASSMFRTDILPYTERFENETTENVETDFPNSTKKDMYKMGMNFMFNFLSIVDEEEVYIESMKKK